MKLSKKKKLDHDDDDGDDGSEAVSAMVVGQVPEIMDQDGPIWVNKFSEDSARAFVKQLHYQSRQDPRTPIVIYIDSNGGDAYALLTMIAAMEQVPNQIVTCALSKAMSAGAMLLACGDIRFATEHSTIMIHEISAGAIGHIDDINVQHTTFIKLNDKLMKLLVKKLKIKGGLAVLKKMLAGSRDLYLDAVEAKALGCVDHIGMPMLHKNVTLQYALSHNPRGNTDDKGTEVKKSKD
jgi:ATP-dependent Clp protease protease subunit